MSVEDWDGTPFQVVITWKSGDRSTFTFEAKKRSVLKEEMLRVLDANTDGFPSVWERACEALGAKIEPRGFESDREGFTISIDLNAGTTPYIHGLAVVWEWDSEALQWLNRHDLMEALIGESDSFCEIASHWMGESEW
jgi:hypothetical protein